MQNTAPQVSIIIPCFNAEKLIGEAIQSALDQTCPHVEVIVIDDGSSDGSLAVIRSFGDRIRWETGPNRGAAAARNRGLAMARGEFIQFTDADDLLVPTKIERHLPEVLRSHADVVFCEGDTVEPRTREEETRFWYVDADDDGVLYILKEGIATPAPLHRKKNLLAVGGFREELPNSQEYDLHLRMACEGMTFQRLGEKLFKVRLAPNSLSSNYLKVLDHRQEILWHSYRLLQESRTLSEARSRAFAACMARSGRHCLQRGDRERGREFFRQAKSMNPVGVLDAYNTPARLVFRCLGPVAAEQLAGIRRRFLNR